MATRRKDIKTSMAHLQRLVGYTTRLGRTSRYKDLITTGLSTQQLQSHHDSHSFLFFSMILGPKCKKSITHRGVVWWRQPAGRVSNTTNKWTLRVLPHYRQYRYVMLAKSFTVWHMIIPGSTLYIFPEEWHLWAISFQMWICLNDVCNLDRSYGILHSI
jgi:hypothetical protein